MQTVLMRPSTASPRPTFASRTVRHPTSAAPSRRMLTLRSALIGDVNDPEKSKQQKRKKEQDSSWSEPSNSNPLEKKGPQEVGSSGASVSEGLQDIGEKAKEAADKLNPTKKD